ncbi:MAG: hypothetical protein BWY69_01332 [Planctomycetes bacterium ADurb.Bin401]|nr:MAG: hypothetical protein BWY69_01332 [Planctomycetes bacterium ADurb.Bin401]
MSKIIFTVDAKNDVEICQTEISVENSNLFARCGKTNRKIRRDVSFAHTAFTAGDRQNHSFVPGIGVQPGKLLYTSLRHLFLRCLLILAKKTHN